MANSKMFGVWPQTSWLFMENSWQTKLGSRNLQNLINLGVDHIDYQINPKFEAKFMVETFKNQVQLEFQCI